MGTYWGYSQDNYRWYARYFIEEKCKVKLGPFYKLEEAQEAVEEYEDSNKQ